MVDDDLWWLWCGTECWGSFIGPHLSLEAAEADKETSGCEHDHMIFCMSMRQMAAKLPATARWWHGSIRDAATTPTRPLIVQPYYPLESVHAWNDYAVAIMELKRERTCV